MAKQKINLKVAGKAYSLTIDSEKEEIYRLAERDVNSNVGKLQKTFAETRQAPEPHSPPTPQGAEVGVRAAAGAGRVGQAAAEISGRAAYGMNGRGANERGER